ncbi:MAG: hypothetical protein JJ879_14190 [Sneathiella sp.]|nr:hypothetical protein [Sneathiella sp.]
MSSEFWLGVLQTGIGSGLGFMFGIGAFHYQLHKQSNKEKKEDWRASLDALNRLTMSAGANIEALANSKRQLIDDLKPEVETMKRAVSECYDTPLAERKSKILSLISTSEALRHFYMSLPKNSVMPPPDFSEYSSLGKNMPVLTLFVHRAMGMMVEINDQIDSRNTLIAEHSRENGTGEGMTAEHVVYYTTMLADKGEAIYEHTDFALDFWRLVIDQVKAYITAKAKGEHYLAFEFVPMAEKAMPKEELFPLMRGQLVSFDG